MLKLDKQLLSQPKEVRFCVRCVVSNQRPRIVFDEEGVCSACRFAAEKNTTIDWEAREAELLALLGRNRQPYAYDVVVPCSGGKDSSYVAHVLREQYGMHPLCVTWAPFLRTDIGRRNFEAFKDSGFTVIEGHPDGDLHRRLARISFVRLGDAWSPFAYGQMAFAFHIAQAFDINLVFFGENGEAEYGGDPKNNYKPHMPLEDWEDLYYKGTSIYDLALPLNRDHVNDWKLGFYAPPKSLESSRVQMHWMSYYRKWDPQDNFYYASEHTGFQPNPERSEGTWNRYASLDDKTDGFHFYMAYIKFGIGRATSDAAHEVRDGRITREEAVALVHRYDGEFPRKHFPDFLEYLGIPEENFWQVVDSWRPEHLWRKGGNGEWELRERVS